MKIAKGFEDEEYDNMTSRESKLSIAEEKDSLRVSSSQKSDALSAKMEKLELELQQEVDDEFEALMRAPISGKIEVSSHPKAQEILAGLRINWMNMRDGQTGREIWVSANWDDYMFEREIKENIPKEILDCRIVSREINFRSREMLNEFRIEQRVYFCGNCIEEWFFKFGFVIPGSTNTWQQVIHAAPKSKMLSAEELSGQVTFETSFYDGNFFICKNLVRIYYV